MTVIDTDTNCTPHLDDLKRRGVTAIGRYYAARGSKRITKTEAQAICAAGLQLFIVYEDSGSPELSVDRGRHDGQIALSQAKAIGQPQGTPIYFAMEHLPNGYTEKDVAGIKRYFEGIRRAFGDSYKIGCYSNGTTLQALLDAEAIQYAWLSASLSFDGSHAFKAGRKWCLAQDPHIDQNWRGVSVDVNDVNGDFGAFVIETNGAEVPVSDAPHPVTVAAKSPTIWSLVVGSVAAVGDGIKHAVDGVKQAFGQLPDISTDLDGLVGPPTKILDVLQIHSAEIGLIIGVACLCIAVVRHVDLHAQVNS